LGNIFRDYFREFIQALNNQQVEYILVGCYPVILHGYAKTTGDLDIWVNPTRDNHNKLVQSFQEFQMPVFDMTEDNFLHNNNLDVFTFGSPPVCVDITKEVKGLDFEQAYKHSSIVETEGFPIRLVD
jgi:hypothetical protein